MLYPPLCWVILTGLGTKVCGGFLGPPENIDCFLPKERGGSVTCFSGFGLIDFAMAVLYNTFSFEWSPSFFGV